MRIRFRALSASVVLLAATFMTAGPQVTQAVAHAAAVATPCVHPYLPHYWSAPPTTQDCEMQLGIACYAPFQFQNAYDLNPLYEQGLIGARRTIAIVDSYGSPTIRADLRTFDRDFGLSNPALRIIQPVGPVPPFDPNDPTMVNWAFETSLDVEYAHAMAPGRRSCWSSPRSRRQRGSPVSRRSSSRKTSSSTT
jgi:subtilase family serine protease